MEMRKVTIEVSDRDGNTITISLRGRVVKQKILQLLDVVELLGGIPYQV